MQVIEKIELNKLCTYQCLARGGGGGGRRADMEAFEQTCPPESEEFDWKVRPHGRVI